MSKIVPKYKVYCYGNKQTPRIIKCFTSKDAIFGWLMDGICGCEGAEREHYNEMMVQLRDGATTLYYDNPPRSMVDTEKYDDLMEEFCTRLCHNFHNPETDDCGDCPFFKHHHGNQDACFAQWLIYNYVD